MTIRALPFDEIYRTRRRLRRELRTATGLAPIRIAVLGGTTTNELVDLLELLLLADGFDPTIRQSEYNKYFEDATLNVQEIREFRPDLVYVHTHVINVTRWPHAAINEAELNQQAEEELSRYRAIWDSLAEHVGCQIIQN